nr:BMP family ABC transporter substrate-binding protein [Exiguobacterium sp. SL14]
MRPEKGRTLANEMMQKKADVLYATGLTGSGVLEAAQTKGKKAIGVDSDQTPIAPDAVMTSMLKQVDLAITKIGQDVVERSTIRTSRPGRQRRSNPVGSNPKHEFYGRGTKKIRAVAERRARR